MGVANPPSLVEDTMNITVRVGKLPGRIGEFVLNGDRTVATALATANLDPTGYELRVQGAPATPATTLSDGDLVLLVKKIKGNGMGCVEAYVGRVPGAALALVAFVEATVLAAIEAAGIDLALDDVVYVNDEVATLASRVSDGDEVVVKKSAVAKVPPVMTIEQAAPSAPFAVEPLPTVVVEGIDPAALRAEAEGLRQQAYGLRENARRDTATAAEHDARAAGCDERASEVEEALAAFGQAKGRVKALGVPMPASAGLGDGLSRLPKATLVSVAKGMGLEVAARATKAQLVAAILGHE
jgi:hypothetical protein